MPKVLIVDDSLSVRKALERLLASRMQVMLANSAEEGMMALNQDRPDLVIADVIMPGLSGFELCALLKQTPAYQDIPVLLISGIVDDQVRQQAQAVGAAGVLSKPFTPEELWPQVDRALSGGMASEANFEAVSAPVVNPPVVAPPENPKSSEPPPAPNIPKDGSLEVVISTLTEKDEVLGVFLVSRNGQILFHQGLLPTDSEALGTYARTLASIGRAVGDRFQLSGFVGLALEFDQQHLSLHQINEQLYLGVLLSTNNMPGLIRFNLQKQMPLLKAMFLME